MIWTSPAFTSVAESERETTGVWIGRAGMERTRAFVR
jgi:hypothetical protein